MNVTPRIRSFGFVLLTFIAIAAFATPSHASHSWNNYHWARTSNPFTIKVIDSMTPDWDDNLATANSDWNTSTVIDVVEEQGDESARTRKRCPAVSGKVRSCNAAYGYTGWLGVAQIWISGGHIVQGTAKMNDSYLASSSYNEINRQHVICQEIGHDWGLGHQDESGKDLNTCMDYASALDNPHPNGHDYDQLKLIYGHGDSTTTVAAMPADVANAELNTPAEWGRLVHQVGRSAIYERDFGRDFKIVTHVTWVDADHARAHSH